MFHGLSGGFLWALDTVMIGLILRMGPFVSTEHAVLIAPLISTFLHDAASALYLGSGILMKKEGRELISLIKQSAARLIIASSILGGPLGMTGYVSSIEYLGAGPTAVISSLFPALGCVFSFIMLNEKMTPSQIGGLAISLIAVALLSFTDSAPGESMLVGVFFAAMCVLGWALEAVLIKHAMVKTDADEIHALFIRQSVSALSYLVAIIPVVKGMDVTLDALKDPAMFWVLASSLFGTLSYVFYYKAIAEVGAGKAMALNITYTAWSVIISSLIARSLPGAMELILSITVVLGALIAAGAVNFRKNSS